MTRFLLVAVLFFAGLLPSQVYTSGRYVAKLGRLTVELTTYVYESNPRYGGYWTLRWKDVHGGVTLINGTFDGKGMMQHPDQTGDQDLGILQEWDDDSIHMRVWPLERIGGPPSLELVFRKII